LNSDVAWTTEVDVVDFDIVAFSGLESGGCLGSGHVSGVEIVEILDGI